MLEGRYPTRSLGLNRDHIEVFEIEVEKSEPSKSVEPTPRPPQVMETKGETAKESPWWGRKSLALLFLLWTTPVFLQKVFPVFRFPDKFPVFFLMLFGYHVLFVPFYCIFCLFKGRHGRAKEAGMAGVISVVFTGVFLFIATQI
jgi:hypothetical protein